MLLFYVVDVLCVFVVAMCSCVLFVYCDATDTSSGRGGGEIQHLVREVRRRGRQPTIVVNMYMYVYIYIYSVCVCLCWCSEGETAILLTVWEMSA